MSQTSVEEFLQRTDALSGPALYRSIDEALQALVGHRLLTVLRLDGTRLYRTYSSQEDHYPAGGFKDISQDRWLREMLAAGEPVLSADQAAVRAHFPDHDAIFALECGAVFNLPVRCGAEVLGSLNLLHREHWFDDRHLALAAPFARRIGEAWVGAARV